MYYHLSCVMRKPNFSYAKTKVQISFAVTAKLISTFVFTTRLAQFFFLNLKFQASVHLLQLHKPVYVRLGQKTLRPFFSCRSSFVSTSCTKMAVIPTIYFQVVCDHLPTPSYHQISIHLYYKPVIIGSCTEEFE